MPSRGPGEGGSQTLAGKVVSHCAGGTWPKKSLAINLPAVVVAPCSNIGSVQNQCNFLLPAVRISGRITYRKLLGGTKDLGFYRQWDQQSEGKAMAGDSSLTVEQVNLEVEKIGSMLRSMSTQIAGIRARVADLEGLEGPHNGNGGGLLAAAKKRPKTGKKVGAKRGKRKPEPAKRKPAPAK